MRYLFFIAILFSSLFAEDFISKIEYEKLLYKNPRGIGCNNCHGEKGEGSVIARYIHKGKNKELIAPPISNISREKFYLALSNPKSIMPIYSLVDDEIESLYNFVNKQK